MNLEAYILASADLADSQRAQFTQLLILELSQRADKRTWQECIRTAKMAAQMDVRK